jgi:integrase
MLGCVWMIQHWGVRGPKFRSAGFYSWTEDDIAAFEAKHPVGTRARLAFALLLYTAQRRADVIKLGRQHLRRVTTYPPEQDREAAGNPATSGFARCA